MFIIINIFVKRHRRSYRGAYNGHPWGCYRPMSYSGVAGGVNPPPGPHSHRSRFFHSRKVTVIKYYNLSLTTRRTINSHKLRKTDHLGGVIASMVECVLTWIRE